MKESKKKKWKRGCYYCKYVMKCENRYKIEVCDKFKFTANCKSI